MDKKEVTYKDSGVDIEAGYEVVKRIKEYTRSTFRKEVLTDIGSFGGFFALGEYRDPVLVSGTDGVGTKLKIAFMMDKHDTVGIDLVAYSVNDIICHGAEPLFFLDYIATGKVSPEKIEMIIRGISTGCKQAGCSLIGGETAEMPGFYGKNEYDLAGFAVGVVEKDKVINGKNISTGDVIIALESSGLQSNGYSLVRKVIFDICNHRVDDYVEELGCTIGEELLKPTKVYAREIGALVKNLNIKGIANITGGGLNENIGRILPEDKDGVIKKESLSKMPIFSYLKKQGNISEDEMYKTFNMGAGMCVVVSANEAEQAIKVLKSINQNSCNIGSVVKGEGKVKLV